ncbi:sulfatase-like hydrolase/transferase [Aromatoleum anaerobium]|uniref:sulfatase-like hydrolase/transferase n=1 Tax=Aromatoleum anaerobium TaxID=182180 RepID=UPI00248C9F91|nr:sulfatase-like hydrolase/transferase [Aromatoleum anaerobium]
MQRDGGARRAAFITGQLPIRTGLTTVGLPVSRVGLHRRDPTLAEVLKTAVYRTGQFGKNHLGDRNEHMPTVHGFDEFFGNLYHPHSESEPKLAMWSKDPDFNSRPAARRSRLCGRGRRGTRESALRPMGQTAL